VKDTKCNRSIFQLQVSALPIEEKESGSLLPTPTTQEIEHPNMKLTKTGRRLTKDGKNSHSLNLADTVKMWPTPTVGCIEGGEQSNRVEKTEKGSYILRKKNKPENTFGAKLSDAVLFEEKIRNWPTPTARDWKDSGKAVVNSPRHSLPQTVAKSDKEQWIKGGGALNPTWVEWLMGYPAEYTDLEDWAILSSRKSSKK
jgi:DNA (cytosine-5)-methyltransferase 1